MTNCLGEVRTHIIHYFNSEKAQKTWWKKYKNGYYPNRKPKKKGKAQFNSQGILVPLDGRTTKKNVKLFD